MSFVEDGGFQPPIDPPADFSGNSSSNEEPVKMALTGSRKAVARMIHLIHRANIISGSEWSKPLATKTDNEVISVANRMIRVD